MVFYCGLDLGQSKDSSAMVLLEKIREPAEPRPIVRYDVRGIKRWTLGTEYPDIVEEVRALLDRPELRGVTLLVDYGGPGRPVYDMLKRRVRCRTVPIAITGGNRAMLTDDVWSVPKRDLIASAQLLFQSRRLKLPANAPEAATLINELESYQVKISERGHDSYDARSGAHDDLVLALCLATWYAQHGPAAPAGIKLFQGKVSGWWTRGDAGLEREQRGGTLVDRRSNDEPGTLNELLGDAAQRARGEE